MTPAETIAAAIEKLESERAAATLGEWRPGRNGYIEADNYGEVLAPGPVDCMLYCYGGTSTLDGDHLIADVDLIVTLHRTIDPVLAILHGAHKVLTQPFWEEQYGEFNESIYRDALAIARAVLEVAS